MNRTRPFFASLDILRAKRLLEQYDSLEEELLIIDSWQPKQVLDNINIVVGCLIGICIQGSMNFTVEKIRYKVADKDIFMFPPGQEVTEIVTSSNFIFSGIMLSNSFIKKTDMFLLCLSIFQSIPVFPYSEQRLIRMTNLLNYIGRNLNNVSHMSITLQMLYSLYSIYVVSDENNSFASLDVSNKKDTYQDIVNCFQLFALKNHGGETNIAICCEELQISTKTLNRAFQFQHIPSPKKCLLQLLICDIEDLLLDPSLRTLEDIEDRLNIKRGNLWRIFKKHVGMTPLEYRKRYRIF